MYDALQLRPTYLLQVSGLCEVRIRMEKHDFCWQHEYRYWIGIRL